jgi:glyoxylase-like metal-dependent hydrolase (beta-lactamase superfamily II)
MQDNSNLSVKTFDVGPMQNIVYLIWNNKTKEGAIIDPAWDLDAVLTFIKNNHIKLTSILLTHSHHDHVNSIDRLLEIYDVPIYINKLEAEFWNKTYDNLIRLDSQAEIFLGEKQSSVHSYTWTYTRLLLLYI